MSTGKQNKLRKRASHLGRAYGGGIDAGWIAALSGIVAAATGSHAEARACFAESLAIAREAGNHWMLTDSLHGLAGLALAGGDPDEAQRLYEESRASFERLGIEGTVGYAAALVGLGDVAEASGHPADAKKRFKEALAARACTAWEKMDAITGIARVAAGEGDLARATELLALVADHPFTSHQTRERVRELLSELEAELPPEVFAAATARGRAREIDEMVAELVGG